MKTDPEKKDQQNVSKGFFQAAFRSVFLILLILKLTATKNDPSKPPSIPRIAAAINTW